MSLQLILGSSGSGKSHYIYSEIIKESIKYPEKNFIVIVPEQYTMSTQKKLVSMHPQKGILNIDILSFERLAYKVFEEVGNEDKPILDDTGKNLIVRRILEQNKNSLKYFGGNTFNTGFVSEIKSVISELLQYDIDAKKMSEIIKEVDNDGVLKLKLEDILMIYNSFKEYIEKNYVTKEEILDVLCKKIEYSNKIKNSVLVFDEFTGFTPVQYNLLSIVLKMCEKVNVTLTIDPREQINVVNGMENLFFMSKDTISKLHKICDDDHISILDPVFIKNSNKSRFNNSKELLHLESNLLRNSFERYKNDVNDIKIYASTVPKEEVNYVANQIIELTRKQGYRYKDIAVVTANIESYGKLAANVFKQNDIPFFLDYKRHISDNPVVVAIEGALAIIEKNYSYDCIFNYLRTGMVGLNKEDIDYLENYCIAKGIKGKKQWHSQWIRNFKKNCPEPDLEKLNDLRTKIISSIDKLQSDITNANGNVGLITRALYDYLVDMHYEETINRLSENEAIGEEYSQIYAKIIEVLDKMVELLGDETVTLREYNKILASGFDEIKIGLIPQTRDCVVIGDIERTRLDDVKVMFFVGVNDGNVPKKNDNRSVLSELERDSLEKMQVNLSPSAKEKAFIQRFYLYLIMTKPSEKLYLTYANAELDGTGNLPSYIIKQVGKLFPKLTIMTCNDVSAKNRYLKIPKSELIWSDENIEKTLAENTVIALLENELTGSVTNFEQFASCQYAFFLRYMLKLSEREEHEFAVVDFGNILHKVIEEVSKRIKHANKSFLLITDEERSSLVKESINAISAEYGNAILKENSRNEYLIERMTTLAEKTVWAIGDQLKNGIFVPDEFEHNFYMNMGSLSGIKYNIKGKIDRIDVCEDDANVYVRVVDYKTFENDFDLLKTYYGLKVQLITYMKAAMDMEAKKHPGKRIVPAGVLYYNIDDPVVDATVESDEEILDKIRKELSMKGMVNDNLDIIRMMDDFEGSSSKTIPVAVTKEGILNKRSTKACSTEQFGELFDYIEKKEKSNARQIIAGDIKINPYTGGKMDSCEYCPYGAVCNFGNDLNSNLTRKMKKISKDEIWDNMKNGVDENGKKLD